MGAKSSPSSGVTGFVSAAEPSFSPLDEELELLPGNLTPHLHEQLVRTGTWIPSFEKARELWASYTGAQVSEATSRRHTEQAGASYVRLQDEAAQRLQQEATVEPVGAEKLFLSADGAMVPLVAGEWAEAKTLAVGEVQPPVERKGEMVVEVKQLSYFSRLAEAETFRHLALVETQRRGVATAGQVVAVSDGSEWIQGLVDYHRPDAVRILDFPHAGERLAQMGQVLYGEQSDHVGTWLSTQLHELKHTGPKGLLGALQELGETDPQAQGSQAYAEHLAYLKKREAHMQYPAYQAAGWPIGDGAVESANKLVVEARLKGSGMHWALGHVNPMLALRNIVCNDRWDEAWTQIGRELRRESWQRRQERRRTRAERAADETLLSPTEHPADCIPPGPAPTPSHAASAQAQALPPSVPTAAQPPGPHRPAANHPWRHSPIGKARYQTGKSSAPPKL